MAVTSTTSVYFTVLVSASTTEREVQAFLYGHSEIIAVVEEPDGRKHYLVRVAAEGTSDENLTDRARYLGQYQAERLASGLHGVSQVYDLQSDATFQHKERTGVELVPYSFRRR